jgi:hypothetical protein
MLKKGKKSLKKDSCVFKYNVHLYCNTKPFNKGNNMNQEFKCSICEEQSEGWGNNPEPIKSLEKDGPCCDTCNLTEVITTRLMLIKTNL